MWISRKFSAIYSEKGIIAVHLTLNLGNKYKLELWIFQNFAEIA